MKKFKDFLTEKGISESDFATKSPDEMAQLYNEYNEACLKVISDDMANKANKDDIPNIDEAIKELVSKDVFKKLEDALKTQGLELTKLKENGGTPSAKKGTYISFIEKNMKETADISKEKNYSASMTIKAAALMTTANVTPNVANGYSPLFGNFIDTTMGGVPKAAPFILPLITVKDQPGTESIWYTDRINEEGDAQFIGEGDLKPLIDAEWVTTKRPIKEVAERWKFSKRLMNHTSSVVDDFREHANELIENKIDDGVVSGDGIGDNLDGIELLAVPFVAPTQLALYYVDANIYDAINAVATTVRLANFKGSITAILNTVWKAKMQGIKKTDGEYIIPPFVSPDGSMVGETKVEFTNRIPDTLLICGDLKKFNAVFSENIEYDEGYENDDFSKNLVSRKLEAFMGTYMRQSDAGSIVSDDISTILTAIDTI